MPGFDPEHCTTSLAARLRIRLPEIIDSDGQWIASDAIAVGSGLPEILIAGADLAPSFGSASGTFISGTREPSLAPLLSLEDRLSCPDILRDALIEFPNSLKEIRSHLLEITGLFGAELPFERVAGYSISDVAKLLELLRRSGVDGAITLSVIMARHAHHRATLHHAKVKAAGDTHGRESLAAWFAPTFVAIRAVLTCVDLVEAWAHHGGSEAKARRPAEICRARLSKSLDSLRDASPQNGAGAAKRNGRALDVVGRLVDNLERLCLDLALDDQAFDRFVRQVCQPEKQENLDRTWSTEQLDIRLNSLLSCEASLDQWTPAVLHLASAADRLDWFLRFRTEGLFRLLALRRLDEVITLFPWLSARMTVFKHVPLGLPGVMAQLFELGRACEIGRELIWRMHEPNADGQDARLSLESAYRRIKSDALETAIVEESRLGTAIVDAGVSHAMLARAMAGDYLAREHPLTQVRFGTWDPDPVAAFTDDRTVASTRRAEDDKHLHRLTSHHDNHYARFYGRTVLEVIFGALFSVFSSSSKRSAVPGATDDGSQLPRETLRAGKAILRNIDPSGIELDKFEHDLLAGHRYGTSPETVGAHSVRKQLCQLKSRVHRSAIAASITMHWDPRNFADDRPLLDLLSRGVEAGSAPIADLFLPVLWFCRDVDLPIWSWLASGAHPAGAPQAMTAKRDEIAFEVHQAHRWAPNLYAQGIPTPLSAKIASILAIIPTWLGLDHKFAEIQ